MILYKQVILPMLTCAAQIWGLAAKTHKKKIQRLQNKILRILTNAHWYVRNDVIHQDLKIESIEDCIQKLSRKFCIQNIDHQNPAISKQVQFAQPSCPYSTTVANPGGGYRAAAPQS
ncbi:hypothetical protein AVEN_162023-1 [Araneus ventricosus]|uniref:RNA-directed DNA polymerase from transposon X-element n=1 Tax=Araneus ventricosus TaxID=182803 RepID=A0A4Y2F566_ARAVE|nr:hypothetical protein AVEN_162023-1 [Araneus ventricosus]